MEGNERGATSVGEPSIWSAVGVMTGTSLDGLDAVVLSKTGTGYTVQSHVWRPWPTSVRRALLGLAEGQPTTAADTARSLQGLSDAIAEAALSAIAAAGMDTDQIRVIGMHGQTLFHQPPPAGVTWQAGWPGWVAAKTGIPTAGDFRVQDVALGGQGAPLAPLTHALLFGDPNERRGVLNIGGIANVTVLDPLPVGKARAPITVAFDTGPGNMVLDGLIQDATQGEVPYDQDGQQARRGLVHPALLDTLLDHPFFRLPPPKSTGREQFGRPFRQAFHGLSLEDALATAEALTIATIARAVEPFALDRVLVAGGGAQNRSLMDRLAHALPCPVDTTDRHGFPGQALEGAAFAVLAVACLDRQPWDLSALTGNPTPTCLGVIAYP